MFISSCQPATLRHFCLYLLRLELQAGCHLPSICMGFQRAELYTSHLLNWLTHQLPLWLFVKLCGSICLVGKGWSKGHFGEVTMLNPRSQHWHRRAGVGVVPWPWPLCSPHESPQGPNVSHLERYNGSLCYLSLSPLFSPTLLLPQPWPCPVCWPWSIYCSLCSGPFQTPLDISPLFCLQ